MRNLAKALVGLSGLAFALAVIAAYTGSVMNFNPGTFGRASLGLAALAIALVVVFESPGGGNAPRG